MGEIQQYYFLFKALLCVCLFFFLPGQGDIEAEEAAALTVCIKKKPANLH